MTLHELEKTWHDDPFNHEMTASVLSNHMDPLLHAYRDFVEKCSYGFGERSMYGMWDALVMSRDQEFVNFLEIGVHRGATLALMGLIASLHPEKKLSITGISPMNGHPDYIKRDFFKDVADLWSHFNIKTPYTILQGLSTDHAFIASTVMGHIKPHSVDLLYIDGSHDYNDVLSDLIIYPALFLKDGGLLVMDDAACDLNLPKNWFPGHQSVTDAVNLFLKKTNSLTFIASVSHNKIFRFSSNSKLSGQ